MFVDGFHGDLSETYLVGKVDENGKILVNVTKQCLEEAIAICGPGKHLKSIGKKIWYVLLQGIMCNIPM